MSSVCFLSFRLSEHNFVGIPYLSHEFCMFRPSTALVCIILAESTIYGAFISSQFHDIKQYVRFLFRRFVCRLSLIWLSCRAAVLFDSYESKSISLGKLECRWQYKINWIPLVDSNLWDILNKRVNFYNCWHNTNQSPEDENRPNFKSPVYCYTPQQDNSQYST